MAAPSTARPPGAVLGLWDGHDAGAALVLHGRLVAAVSEERLTRVKCRGGFPERALAEVLRLGGVAPVDVELVAVAGVRGRLPARLFDRRYRDLPPQDVDPLSPASHAFALYQNRLARLPILGDLEEALATAALRRRLHAHGLGGARLQLVDHHTAHATTAAALLGGDGLVVTMDGYGDGLASAVWAWRAGQLRRLDAQGPAASLALLYGALTRLLGFKEGEEGKVTGLAGLATDAQVQAAGLALGDRLQVHAGRLQLDRRGALRRLRAAQQAGVAPAILARALQKPLEAAVEGVVRHHLAATGLRRLGLAGGLFANVALTGRLAALDLDELAVFPAMTDQGLCVGAAFAVVPPGALQPVPSMRLGPDIAGEPPRPDDVAARLAAGAVVGIARGRMEFGPRALGCRSILCHPGRPELAARVNAMLGRDGFMPFAPILPAERWDEAFELPYARVARAAGEMTLALPVRPALQRLAPVAVHGDGTARPQALREAEDPWLHAVLRVFAARTGCPALVNTSFNRHREPIVDTAEQALASARAAGLDGVVVGGRWLEPARDRDLMSAQAASLAAIWDDDADEVWNEG